jgi:hypothetical protein
MGPVTHGGNRLIGGLSTDLEGARPHGLEERANLAFRAIISMLADGTMVTKRPSGGIMGSAGATVSTRKNDITLADDRGRVWRESLPRVFEFWQNGCRGLDTPPGGGNDAMPHRRTVTQVLDRDFLEIRARLLELAASLDRIDRAAAEPGHPPDARLAQIRAGLEALLVPDPGRAETVQRLFSLEYDPAWLARFELSPGRRS